MATRVLDARVLMALARGVPRRGSHTERLQAFYGPQAEYYDTFRARLLSGREDLVTMMAPADGADIVELGGGTGYNLTYFRDRLNRLGQVEIVDLCPALLQQARRRWAGHPNVRVVESDATCYVSAHPVDCVYFSYALTMIPNWRAAIANAIAMLKPGGTLGVVDFYVSSARPAAGLAHHDWFTRGFWPRWFAHDGVKLSPDPMSLLRTVLPDHRLSECLAALPYIPVLRVPYYIFVGRKPL
jgi:S-adenosylmethionine-diacylgycerolhomoserine-N-methlytransferase